MGQTAMSGEVSTENLDMENSIKTSLENIFSKPLNSEDQIINKQEILISNESDPEIEDFQELETFLSASNSISHFLTDLNKELETQDSVRIEWAIAKGETQDAKPLQEQFEMVKISEITCEKDIAMNTDIIQNQILNLKEETIPNAEDQQEPVSGCLSSKSMVNVLKNEILKDITLFTQDTANLNTSLILANSRVDEDNFRQFKTVVTTKKSCSKNCSPKENSQNSSAYLDNPLEKESTLDNNADRCKSAYKKYTEKREAKVPDLPVELEAVSGKCSRDRQVINQESRSACKPLKCRSWNASNERGASAEFSSKVKPLSLEHTCESPQGISSKSSKIHRDTLTITKMEKLPEVSKYCHSTISSKNDSPIDRKCQDVGCSQNEDVFDYESFSSHKQTMIKKKDSKLETSPGEKLDCKRLSHNSSSSSRSRSRSRDRRTSLDTYKVSKLSDKSPSRSTECSSSFSSEIKLQKKKQASQKSFATEDNLPLLSMIQYRKVSSPKSSLGFLQDKISSLLIDDQKVDLVMEMAKLTERNFELEEELSQKELKIDKLAQQSESVIERCEEIEVGLVSNLVITDEKISKLSRTTNLAKRFQLENNALWNQIDKLKEMLVEKDREISRLLLSKGNDTRRDEMKTLKEKLNSLEHEFAALSINFRKSEKMCRQYEKDLEGLERNLRLTFLDLKSIVRNQTSKRKSQDSGHRLPKEMGNDITFKQSKDAERENTR